MYCWLLNEVLSGCTDSIKHNLGLKAGPYLFYWKVIIPFSYQIGIKAPEGHIGCKFQAPNSPVLEGSTVYSLLASLDEKPLAKFNGLGIGFLVLLTLFFKSSNYKYKPENISSSAR